MSIFNMFKKKSKNENWNISAEEISEKKTSWMWYFLLICMFFAIISSARMSLGVIQDMVRMPSSITACIKEIHSNTDIKNKNERKRYGESCNLKLEDPKVDFRENYKELKDVSKKITEIKDTNQTLESSMRRELRKKQKNEQDYNSSSLEKVSNEQQAIYDRQNIKESILILKSSIKNKERQINKNLWKIEKIIKENSNKIERLNQKVIDFDVKYNNSYLKYKFKVAFLSLLFVLIVFYTLLSIHKKQKAKNSPNTIIFSVATFAYGMIFLQVSLKFLRDIIPIEFIRWIGSLLSTFMPLVYLVQLIRPIIIISVFWFAVYKIQKKIYSSENILKRILDEKKCPKCWNAADIKKPFCPICANKILIKCNSCDELTIKGMSYCSSCWKDIEE